MRRHDVWICGIFTFSIFLTQFVFILIFQMISATEQLLIISSTFFGKTKNGDIAIMSYGNVAVSVQKLSLNLDTTTLQTRPSRWQDWIFPSRSNHWDLLKFVIINGCILFILGHTTLLNFTFEYIKLNWILAHKWPWTSRSKFCILIDFCCISL